MLNKNQAEQKVKNFIPGTTPKAWAQYKNLYLFRVEFPSEEEKNWDPFISVDINTGKVQDFSILPVLSEVMALNWEDV